MSEGLLICINQEHYIHRKKNCYLVQSKSLGMGKPISTLHSLGSWRTLSLFRLGRPLAAPTRQSHAAWHSGLEGAEAFKSLTALQQAGEGLLTLVVRKAMHSPNDAFAFSQSKPFTSFVPATARTNTIAKGTKDPHTLFIFPPCFLSIFHFSFFLVWMEPWTDAIYRPVSFHYIATCHLYKFFYNIF